MHRDMDNLVGSQVLQSAIELSAFNALPEFLAKVSCPCMKKGTELGKIEAKSSYFV